MRQKDVILSVGTVALVLLAVVVVAATGSTDEFVAWAWERHHNVLSWYIRPSVSLPFCYFAYKRSLSGMMLTLVALATSMFWFPAPERADPEVARVFGRGEGVPHRGLDDGEGTPGLARADQLCGVGLVFWKRSIVYGLVLMQRDSVGKARVELLLRGRVGRADLAALRTRGLGGL